MGTSPRAFWLRAVYERNAESVPNPCRARLRAVAVPALATQDEVSEEMEVESGEPLLCRCPVESVYSLRPPYFVDRWCPLPEGDRIGQEMTKLRSSQLACETPDQWQSELARPECNVLRQQRPARQTTQRVD